MYVVKFLFFSKLDPEYRCGKSKCDLIASKKINISCAILVMRWSDLISVLFPLFYFPLCHLNASVPFSLGPMSSCISFRMFQVFQFLRIEHHRRCTWSPHALSPYAVTLEKIWRKLTCLQQPRHFCTSLRQHSSHSTFSFSPSVLTCLLSYSSLNTASLSSKICLPNHFRKTSLQIGHRNFVPFLSRCALISLDWNIFPSFKNCLNEHTCTWVEMRKMK